MLTERLAFLSNVSDSENGSDSDGKILFDRI